MGGGAYGCGQCLPCRIDRRRVWTHRIMLEAAQHDYNSFATLTFGDDHLPKDNSVSPRDLQTFIKRLRKASPERLRYFACGEYGETTGRPHYHIALFGFRGCDYGITRGNRATCCDQCSLLSESWGRGLTQLGTLEQASAAYIAGYVSKKWTRANDPKGRHPSFARMSLRPGIGLGMMHELASTLMQHKLDETMIDVPLTLQHGTAKWPLGRYLRRKLRTFIGKDANAPKEVLDLQAAELQVMREAAWANSTSLTNEVLKNSLGRRIQIESKHRRQKRETI